MRVRWFAGAAQAAGVKEEIVDDPRDGTVAEVLVALRPGAAAVLGRCSFLADGRRVGPGDAWPNQAEIVDVLPPFVGG